MAIGTPVNLGTNSTKSNTATIVITTLASVPTGAMIYVAIESGSTAPTVNDSASNSYSNIVSTPTSPALYGFVCLNANALSSGSSITINLVGTGANAVVSAFYVTGIAASSAVDKTNTNSGSSTSPTVSTIGATTHANELTVGVIDVSGPIGDTFTQDSTDAAYQNFPVRVGTTGASASSNDTIDGGSFIETATGTKTYAPTLGTSRAWKATIVTFIGAPTPFIAVDPFMVNQTINRASTY